LPWERNLAGPQRVWFAVYNKAEERRLRRRLEEFEISTKRAKHGWVTIDLTNAFAQWLSNHEYRDGYFETPEHLEGESPAALHADRASPPAVRAWHRQAHHSLAFGGLAGIQRRRFRRCPSSAVLASLVRERNGGDGSFSDGFRRLSSVRLGDGDNASLAHPSWMIAAALGRVTGPACARMTGLGD
jgi:hypothetical protein